MRGVLIPMSSGPVRAVRKQYRVVRRRRLRGGTIALVERVRKSAGLAPQIAYGVVASKRSLPTRPRELDKLPALDQSGRFETTLLRKDAWIASKSKARRMFTKAVAKGIVPERKPRRRFIRPGWRSK